MVWVFAILALGFLIVVHEGGHYFVARWCRMRVERFSIGFGPGLVKHKAKNGTIFQLAPIPFGGFVEIRGMNIAEEVDPDDLYAYPNRPAWQRFITILAGPATNYLSAIFLAFGLYTCIGMPGSSYRVDQISEGHDAVGKLMPGDRILEVDGVEMFSPKTEVLGSAVNKHHGAPVKVTVLRGYERVTVTITPKIAKNKAGNDLFVDNTNTECTALGPNCFHLYRLGVTQQKDMIDVSFGTAARAALEYPIEQSEKIFQGFKDIIVGKEAVDAGGPVRIVEEFKNAFDSGLGEGIRLLMLLSVYLGLFNLLPLPALDGGRLVFLGYEMVTRRRANPKIETMVHMGGIMVLMVLLILVTLKDCSRIL